MLVDSLVDERYRLLRLLGGHGHTEVWCARDERLGRLVAVRLPEGVDDPAPQAAVRQCTLFDDRLTRILDIGTGPWPAYVVTEWIDGECLLDCATRSTSTDELVEIVAEAAAAIAAAHRADLAHGRLTGESLVLGTAGLVKVIGAFAEARPASVADDVLTLRELLRTALLGRRLCPKLHRLLRQTFSSAAELAAALEPHRSGSLRNRLVSPEPTDGPVRADMRRAREVMATGIVTVSEDTPVRELAAILAASPFSAVPVVDSTGHVTGLVTASDLVRGQGCRPVSSRKASTAVGRV